jgi:hypothetical protein
VLPTPPLAMFLPVTFNLTMFLGQMRLFIVFLIRNLSALLALKLFAMPILFSLQIIVLKICLISIRGTFINVLLAFIVPSTFPRISIVRFVCVLGTLMIRLVLTACLHFIDHVPRSLATPLSFLTLEQCAITGVHALALAIAALAAHLDVVLGVTASHTLFYAAIFGSSFSVSLILILHRFLFKMCFFCISKMMPAIAVWDKFFLLVPISAFCVIMPVVMAQG